MIVNGERQTFLAKIIVATLNTLISDSRKIMYLQENEKKCCQKGYQDIFKETHAAPITDDVPVHNNIGSRPTGDGSLLRRAFHFLLIIRNFWY